MEIEPQMAPMKIALSRILLQSAAFMSRNYLSCSSCWIFCFAQVNLMILHNHLIFPSLSLTHSALSFPPPSYLSLPTKLCLPANACLPMSVYLPTITSYQHQASFVNLSTFTSDLSLYIHNRSRSQYQSFVLFSNGLFVS